MDLYFSLKIFGQTCTNSQYQIHIVRRHATVWLNLNEIAQINLHVTALLDK
jgi:hypothetical protein